MRHRIFGKKLGRNTNSRKALAKSLMRALIERGKIETTLEKAKFLRPFIEKLITVSKKGNLTDRRRVISRLGDVDSAKKLFEEIAPKFGKRNGGYTRIRRSGVRLGDRGQKAVISFVEYDEMEAEKPVKATGLSKSKKSGVSSKSKSKTSMKPEKKLKKVEATA